MDEVDGNAHAITWRKWWSNKRLCMWKYMIETRDSQTQWISCNEYANFTFYSFGCNKIWINFISTTTHSNESLSKKLLQIPHTRLLFLFFYFKFRYILSWFLNESKSTMTFNFRPILLSKVFLIFFNFDIFFYFFHVLNSFQCECIRLKFLRDSVFIRTSIFERLPWNKSLVVQKVNLKKTSLLIEESIDVCLR